MRTLAVLMANFCFMIGAHVSAFAEGSLPSLVGAELTCAKRNGNNIKLTIEKTKAASAHADRSYWGQYEAPGTPTDKSALIDQYTIATRCEVGWSLIAHVNNGDRLAFSTIDANPCEGGKTGTEATLTEFVCPRDELACKDIVSPLECSIAIPLQ